MHLWELNDQLTSCGSTGQFISNSSFPSLQSLPSDLVEMDWHSQVNVQQLHAQVCRMCKRQIEHSGELSTGSYRSSIVIPVYFTLCIHPTFMHHMRCKILASPFLKFVLKIFCVIRLFNSPKILLCRYFDSALKVYHTMSPSCTQWPVWWQIQIQLVGSGNDYT